MKKSSKILNILYAKDSQIKYKRKTLKLCSIFIKSGDVIFREFNNINTYLPTVFQKVTKSFYPF